MLTFYTSSLQKHFNLLRLRGSPAGYFILLLLLALPAILYPDQLPSFAITESLPASIVAGSVNVITGDHYFTEDDITIQGAFPLKIPRTYISSSKSWTHFPHFFAYLAVNYRREDESQDHDVGFLTLQITEANGTVLIFKDDPYAHRGRKAPIIFHLPSDSFRHGLTNTAKGEISGKTNLKNSLIEMEQGEKSFLFYAADGAIRYYQRVTNNGLASTYLLQWERMPNQSLICYGHDRHHRLNMIRMASLNGTKTFASASISYHSDKPAENSNYDIHTSDGRTLNYRFDKLSYQFYLTHAKTPAYPQEFISYHKIKDGKTTWGYLLGHRDVSCHRHYNVDYYWEGRQNIGGEEVKIKSSDPRWLRVKSLSSPVGDDHISHVTHTFTYD